MRTLPQSIRQAPSPASADDPKNPFGEAKWAFYVPPQRLKEADAHAGAQEREPPKWGVSVPLKGLTLTVDSDTVGPLFCFHQDHLRIDQVAASLRHRQQNKINAPLFIYLESDNGDIAECFHKLMSCEAERHRCTKDFRTGRPPGFTALPLPAQICPSCICFQSVHFQSFFPSPALVKLTSELTTGSVNVTPPLLRSGLFAQQLLHPADRLGSVPPPLPPLSLPPDVCLSICLSPSQEKQPPHLSINVLSFHFLFLSVYLSVWHVGSCLGAPGLLSATCWFLFFCQFTCLSGTLRLDASTCLLDFLFLKESFRKRYQRRKCAVFAAEQINRGTAICSFRVFIYRTCANAREASPLSILSN